MYLSPGLFTDDDMDTKLLSHLSFSCFLECLFPSYFPFVLEFSWFNLMKCLFSFKWKFLPWLSMCLISTVFFNLFIFFLFDLPNGDKYTLRGSIVYSLYLSRMSNHSSLSPLLLCFIDIPKKCVDIIKMRENKDLCAYRSECCINLLIWFWWITMLLRVFIRFIVKGL